MTTTHPTITASGLDWEVKVLEANLGLVVDDTQVYLDLVYSNDRWQVAVIVDEDGDFIVAGDNLGWLYHLCHDTLDTLTIQAGRPPLWT
jgi:hypothetical protein